MFAVDAALSTTVEAILLAIFLAWATRHPEHPIGRVLNIRPLRIVGIASYSLYLYQQLFFEEAAPFHWPVPVGLLALCGCAFLSYRLVEVPALRFRVWAEGIIWPVRREARAGVARVHV
jgi:peptidoglycan/LPS O-acetylase OafA/YrhL